MATLVYTGYESVNLDCCISARLDLKESQLIVLTLDGKKEYDVESDYLDGVSEIVAPDCTNKSKKWMKISDEVVLRVSEIVSVKVQSQVENKWDLRFEMSNGVTHICLDGDWSDETLSEYVGWDFAVLASYTGVD